MSKRKIIITADDYGVSPIIDDAIQVAVANGCVTAVATFANGKNYKGEFSVEKAKRLKDSFNNISIGMHFTITSGERVSDMAYSLSKRHSRKFRSLITQFPEKAIENHLKLELEAQIAVFDKTGLDIEFFSDHNGIISTSEVGLKILIEVISNYINRKKLEKAQSSIPFTKIPLRNPLFLSCIIDDPKNGLDKSAMYRRARAGIAVKNMFRRKSLTRINLDFNCLKSFLKEIHDNNITTPDYLIENFYARPKEETLKCIVENAPNVEYQQRNAINANCISSEVVVHLGKVPFYPEKSPGYITEENKLRSYGGISVSYLRNHRCREFEVLNSCLKKYVGQEELCSFNY